MILISDIREQVNLIMDEDMPTNLIKEKSCLAQNQSSNNNDVSNNCEQSIKCAGTTKVLDANVNNCTKIKLSFSVERLLNAEEQNCKLQNSENPCDHAQKYFCLPDFQARTIVPSSEARATFYQSPFRSNMLPLPYLDLKTLVKPTPIRVSGKTADSALSLPFTDPIAFMRLHEIQQSKQKSTNLAQTMQSLIRIPTLQHSSIAENFTLSSSSLLPSQLCALNALQIQSSANNINTNMSSSLQLRKSSHSDKSNSLTTTNTTAFAYNNYTDLSTSNMLSSSVTLQNSFQHSKQGLRNNSGLPTGVSSAGANKRKRSWSRAVFSNLQRKGLEIQFQQQKYITKPDRRKLAARLNLTDAQVKVWFQNRRMKWRHTRENLKSGQEKLVSNATATASNAATGVYKSSKQKQSHPNSEAQNHSYSSADGSSSAELSESEDNDEGEIDVVE